MARVKTSAVVKNVPPEAIELFAKLKEQRATVASCYEAKKKFPDYHRDRTRLHRLMFPPVYYHGKLVCGFWHGEDIMYCCREEPPPYYVDKYKRDRWARGWEARCKLEAALKARGLSAKAEQKTEMEIQGRNVHLDGDIVRHPDRAERILDFIETLTVPSGVGQGEKFRLMEFEKQFIRDLYEPHRRGEKHDDT